MKLLAIVLIMALACGGVRSAPADDPGLDEIGTIKTELIFGTNGDLTALGKDAKALPAKEQKRFQESTHIPRYKRFVSLGSDTKPILRGYKNWAAPMANSADDR